MISKLFWTALIVGGVVTFVGADVVGGTVRRARESVRARLTADVPLRTRLAEAQAGVDRYADNVIRGEIAAEALADRIVATRRELASRSASIGRERAALAALRTRLETEPTARLVSDGPGVSAPAEREALRRARALATAVTLLERRTKDLEALEADQARVVRELEGARGATARLADELRGMKAELEALEARESVAQTRTSCALATAATSGFGEARARLDGIRDELRARNKRLELTAYAPETDALEGSADGLPPGDPLEALNAVLGPVAK